MRKHGCTVGDSLPLMAVASDLAAFFAEHELCPDLGGSLLPNRKRVVLTCGCGGRFSRAVHDLAQNARADAQFRGGLNYARHQNYAAAVKSYRLAALQSHVGAQNNLGVLYDRGTGVSQDRLAA